MIFILRVIGFKVLGKEVKVVRQLLVEEERYILIEVGWDWDWLMLGKEVKVIHLVQLKEEDCILKGVLEEVLVKGTCSLSLH